MNTRKCREKFKNFQILLDSGCSSTIVMVKPIKNPKEDAVIQWNTEEVSVLINLKVKIYLTISELHAKKSWRGIVIWMTLLMLDMT